MIVKKIHYLFHTIEQTAELMNYSVSTVKRKQSEAIRKLIPFELVWAYEKCYTDIIEK